MVTLVLGGVRSGKSRYAQLEAARFSRVTFVATARPSDAEMRRKIAAHRRERPAAWKTVEVSAALDAVIRREGQKGRAAPDRLPHDLLWGAAVSEPDRIGPTLAMSRRSWRRSVPRPHPCSSCPTKSALVSCRPSRAAASFAICSAR